MTCTYRFTGPAGEPVVIEGLPAMKAYLAEGGLEFFGLQREQSSPSMVKFSATRAAQTIRQYANDYADAMFRTPRTDAKDMATIAQEVGSEFNIPTPEENNGLDARADRMWVFNLAGVNDEGRHFYRAAYISEKNNAVWVNVASLSPGMAGGAIYQIAGAYARNNGKVFIGDPDGITEAGKRRRLENMISLALKYDGETQFIKPHDDMLGWNGLQWGNNPEHNLLFMLRTATRITEAAVPEVKEVNFDPTTGTFTRAGDPFGGADFARLAKRSRESAPLTQRAGMPGSGALRLASIFQSLGSQAPVERGADARVSDDLGSAGALRDSLTNIRWSTQRLASSPGASAPQTVAPTFFNRADRSATAARAAGRAAIKSSSRASDTSTRQRPPPACFLARTAA